LEVFPRRHFYDFTIPSTAKHKYLFLSAAEVKKTRLPLLSDQPNHTKLSILPSKIRFHFLIAFSRKKWRLDFAEYVKGSQNSRAGNLICMFIPSRPLHFSYAQRDPVRL
jgi:hypothetical protein